MTWASATASPIWVTSARVSVQSPSEIRTTVLEPSTAFKPRRTERSALFDWSDRSR